MRISGSLRYLINMIIEIMKDMAAFVIVLLYWIIGYSFIFYIFAVAKTLNLDEEAAPEKEEDPNAEPLIVTTLKEIYRLAYGDFAPDEYS